MTTPDPRGVEPQTTPPRTPTTGGATVPGGATGAASATQSADTSDASIGELVSHLFTDVSALVRQEVELAKAEIRAEANRATKAGTLFAGAAGVGLLAAILLSFALAWLLAEVMPTWVGFLIVGLVYAVVAAVLATNGRKRMQQINPVPQQTVETLQEDAQWAKNRTR